jgi:3-isopropylmalate dehydrogenase
MLPGDGIGPEIMAEARSLLKVLARQYPLDLEISEHIVGGAAIDQTGEPLPAETLAACRAADIVLLGAVGGPKWSDPNARVRPEQGLLALRKELGLFMNLRPVKVHPQLAAASPLKPERLEGVDIMVVRELTGGIYFGAKTEEADSASDLCSYTREEVERVVVRAAEIARRREGTLTLVDKANILATSRLWRRVTAEIMARQFPEVHFESMLVDAAAMFLVTEPSRFSVIVTENMFGDILTDEASVLAGSMGMLPSASLGEGGAGLYEPIHGSAPDIAGQGIANPFGMLASVAMACRYGLRLREAAERIELAISACVSNGECTPDLGGTLSTGEAGRAMRRHLDEYYVPLMAHG